MLKNATTLYRASKLPDKHTIVKEWLRQLNGWQQDRFLVAERENNIKLYLFTEKRRYEICVFILVTKQRM
jgi:hypothetical protein